MLLCEPRPVRIAVATWSAVRSYNSSAMALKFSAGFEIRPSPLSFAWKDLSVMPKTPFYRGEEMAATGTERDRVKKAKMKTVHHA